MSKGGAGSFAVESYKLGQHRISQRYEGRFSISSIQYIEASHGNLEEKTVLRSSVHEYSIPQSTDSTHLISLASQTVFLHPSSHKLHRLVASRLASRPFLTLLTETKLSEANATRMM